MRTRLRFAPLPGLLGLALALALACGDGGRAETPASTAQHARASSSPTASTATAAPENTRERESFQPPGGDGWGRAGDLVYLERVLGGGAPDAAMPMLVLIHGLGDRPRRDWFGGAEAIDVPLRLIMPQAPTPYHDGYAWFPFRARDDDPAALARGITAAAERLARSIDLLRARRPTLGRPIVAGFSQGGMLSYALALQRPELVALSHPISGMLPEPLWPASKPAGTRYPRIAAMHGDADELVPIAAARALTRRLRELGHEVELREFAGVGHTITAAMDDHSVALLNAAARELAAR